jgi:phenylalanyl-tRNA synthetase beta chain
MKVTLNWLREFVPIELPVTHLAERLTMAGLEVEAVSELGAEPIRIARIVRIEPHAQADHLVVCHVTTGEEPVPVVCGAKNMREGDNVAFAPAGTTLPGGKNVERTEIRGQLSCGMLCSESELGLSPDHSGLLIVQPEAPIGELLFPFLHLHDTVLDIAITPNRGDCLSVLGLAREIAALTGATLLAKKPRIRERGTPVTDRARVTIVDPDLCPRYAARVVTGVRVAPSPAWVRWRLEAVGIRSLNNLIDVTNYVMIERGQPLHAFDLEALAGAEIIVRRARDIGSLKTLDGQDRALIPDDLLICDRDRGVALAGVMGGENSEVREQTTNVLLESAYFTPETVRQTARRLGLRTEASYRFERGVDPEGTVLALDRAAALLVELAGGQICRGVIDECTQPPQRTVIPLRAQRVEALLGASIEEKDIEQCLRTLGAIVKRKDRGTWQVSPPAHRSDLTQEADLVEEVARLRGYETIPTLLPKAEIHGDRQDREGHWSRRVRVCLAAQGMAEMLNLSFTSARLNRLFPGFVPDACPIPVINPLSTEDAELRLSLLSNLLRALQLNIRQGELGVAAFELGKVFYQQGVSPSEHKHEQMRLSGVLFGEEIGFGLGERRKKVEFFDLKGILEALCLELHCNERIRWSRSGEVPFLHPGKSAALTMNGAIVGLAGALHPTHCTELGFNDTPWIFELDFTSLLNYARTVTRYQSLPRFPVVVRDFAIVAHEELPAQAVVDTVNELAHPLILGVHLFDIYRGGSIPAKKKSLAYSISYRAPDRTLTAAEVNVLHAQVVDHLVQKLGVEVRT